MNADQLRAFVAIARMGTVGRAADALGRTQPSISTRLSDLESSWATRLFHRRARGMDLTPEGERLLPMAVSALASMDELDRAAGKPLAGGSTLRVGAGDALGRGLLPAALKNLLARFPGVDVRIVEGAGSRLLETLQRGEIDVALVTGGPREHPAAAALPFRLLLRSRVSVLIPESRKLRGKHSVGLHWLSGERLVTLQPGSSFRRFLEREYSESGFPFRPAVEVGSFSLVRRYVAAGLGVAPVPAVALDPKPGGNGIQVRRLRNVRSIAYYSVVRSAVPLPEPAAALIEGIREA
ncbi:MAG: LysR family transcriptional regulator [Acidobacteria bacterium]|uniref:LysR family transcriptional regulator n=1 Tax=Candidatus Polarisedimenticola svalbardensis TaxID=2886004 RepID=A0A8J7C2T4_9BACT|nr:LysR family transcriptional regulator [Candidatus Polarisedimenticola svalbardensis]